MMRAASTILVVLLAAFGIFDNARAQQDIGTLELFFEPSSVRVIAVDDTATTEQDQPVTIPVSNLLANDRSELGGPLSIVSVDDAQNGSVSLQSPTEIVFDPASGFAGSASFRYTVRNSSGVEATAQVMVAVTEASPPPTQQPIQVGDLKLVGPPPPPEQQPIQVGELKLVGPPPPPEQEPIQVGELKLVGPPPPPEQQPIQVGELKLVGPPPPHEQPPIDVGELRLVDPIPAQEAVFDIGGFILSGDGPLPEQPPIDIGELRLVDPIPAQEAVFDIGGFVLSGDAPLPKQPLEVETDELVFTGYRRPPTRDVAVDPMQFTGDGPRKPPAAARRLVPKNTKFALLRVRKIAGETNPFDFAEVREDIRAAKAGTLGATTTGGGGGGGAATALTVAGVPLLASTPIAIHLNAAGTALTVDTFFPTPTDVIDIQVTGGLGDVTIDPDFTEISTSGGLNGLGVGNFTRQIVVRRNSDLVFFQLNLNFDVNFLDADLNTLTGFNCGTSAANCP